MYKTILLHLTDGERAVERIALTRKVAERFGSAVVGLIARPLPFVPAAFGEAAYVGPEIIEAQRAAAQVTATRLRALFEQGFAGSGLATEVVDEEGDDGTLVSRVAHTADLVVVAQADAEGLEAMVKDVAEQAAVASGVPVLTLPARVPVQDLGHAVLIGWNGSREAARAVGDALPFLGSARKTVLLAVGDDAAESVERAAQRLRRHGIEPQVEVLSEPEGSIGEVLLTVARTKGCDLISIGAYGHARLRQLILGGATRSLIRTSPIPVMFSA